MERKRRSPNPMIAVQRGRVRRYLGIGLGEGAHLTYLGYIIPENEARMDAFLYFRDEWEDCKIGLPQIILVDVSGTDVRDATPEEVDFCLGHKLPRREPEDEPCVY